VAALPDISRLIQDLTGPEFGEILSPR